MTRTYTYNFTDPDSNTDQVVITTSDNATTDSDEGLGYDITSISGTFDGQQITGMVGTAGPQQSDGANNTFYDNVIFTDDSAGLSGSFDGLDNAGIEFSASNNQDYNIFTTGTTFTVATNGSDNGTLTLDSFDPPCYCRGTRILTDRGEVAVEALAVGDIVITASGERKPVKWLGRRSLDGSRHPDPESVWPIRVSAGAFGDNEPARDLWLSPGHSIAAEGALIPVKALQNGKSVAQHERSTVEYWHVELDQHDILLAEGLPAESYLDTGNRTAFANGGAFIEAHPDFQPKHWAQTCLPLVFEGPEVVRTKALLLDRLQRLGQATTEDADLHVIADGARIEPTPLGPMRFAFALPSGCKAISLMSRSFIPAHTLAGSVDTRRLGICLRRLQIDGDTIPLDDASLNSPEWNDLERRPGRDDQRWTAGRASLPANTRLVVIDLAAQGYYWPEPRNNVVALFG